MGFGFTLVVLTLGACYIRKVENRMKVQDAKIFLLEQLLEMNLIQNGKEESKNTEAQKTKGETT